MPQQGIDKTYYSILARLLLTVFWLNLGVGCLGPGTQVGTSVMVLLRKLVARSAILFAAALCSANASAATVMATLQSFGVGDTITLNAVRPNGTPMAQQVLLGSATFARTGGTETATLAGTTPGSFLAFCIEPYESISLNGNYTFESSPLASAANSSISGGIGGTRAAQVSSLFGQFAPNLASPMSVLQASALQIALWEIVSELPSNPFDVSSGNTFFTTPASADFAAVMDMAQYYLTHVTSDGSGAQALGLASLTINGVQDFLVQTDSIAAPEPGTWLMMLGGFGLVGFAMRRRQVRGRLLRTA